MNRMTMRRYAGAVAAAAVIFGLTGCGVLFPQEQPPVVHSASFLKRFNAVCNPGSMIPLRSITTVEWDEAFVFPEATSPEVFEATTGNPAIEWAAFGNYTPGDSLLVLQKDGEFVEVIEFIPAQIYGNREHPSFAYDADVLVRMTQNEIGCYGELVPAQTAPAKD